MGGEVVSRFDVVAGMIERARLQTGFIYIIDETRDMWLIANAPTVNTTVDITEPYLQLTRRGPN